MSGYAIRVEGLGKKYLIGHRQLDRHPTFKDFLTRSTKSLARTLRSPFAGTSNLTLEELWALKEISFEVQSGERIGIIGRNGAGKSTLLKILSRVTEPTEGRISLRGRVASLLEVGTGFHPELTGRENIYLNGAILGMRKAEIQKKFDEIVDFSEVEKFLDTPVKRYSSGMYVRLAFAVAAHLEPEILIVDEVLAVGDAAFQRKCLGKMENVATKEGRTILFVSHNMAAVQSLCQRALRLEAGRLIEDGESREVTQHYLESASPERDLPLDQRADRSGDGSVRLTSVTIESKDDDKVIRPSSRLQVTIGYRSQAPVRFPDFQILVYDYESSRGIFLLSSDASGELPESLPPEGFVTCVTEPINLTPGRCFVNLAVKKGKAQADYIQYAKFFDVVEEKGQYRTSKYPPRHWMLTVIKHKWSTDGEA